jgi:DNA polymerase III alpha subunit
MGGLVEKVRRRTTRNKDPMAVLKVLDTRNSFECVLFPRAYQQYRELVQEGEVLFFVGRISHDRGTSVVADGVIPFEKAQGRAVYVSVPAEEADAEFWTALRGVLRQAPGPAPVYVELESAGFRLRCRVGNGTKVQPTQRLAQGVEELVGPRRVKFDMRRAGRREEARRPGAGGYFAGRSAG